MAGLASFLLGDANPISQFAAQNSRLLGSIGAGFANGTDIGTGLAKAAMFAPKGRLLDEEHAAQIEADKKAANLTAQAEALKTKYADFFNQNGQPDYARAVADGIMEPGAAYEDWMKGKAGGGVKPMEINGQLVDPTTGKVIGDYRSPDKPAATPTSYQEYQLAQSDPAYAASLSSSSTKPPTEGERRNQQLATVIKPELATVEKNWKALTDGKDQMVGAEVNGNRPGMAFTSPEYQQAINSLSTIVASYLYSVSGATATDEEIKRQVSLLTPKLGESEASANQKLDRIRTYAAAVEGAAGRAANNNGGGAPDPLGIR